jgi:hypothetical protein
MRKISETWITPVVTGFLATVFGGLALLWLGVEEGYQKTDLSSNFGRTGLTFPAPPLDEWEAVANDAPYARNYSRREKRPFELYRQIVTIYKTPMSADRRQGKQVAPGEYLQIFKVGSSADVVMQLRVDKGNYWLLSRQRVSLNDHTHLIADNPERDDASFHEFQVALQNIIDTTRHFLQKQL